MKIYSVSQAAKEIGIDTSLVRRMCRKHEIGVKLSERARVLTAADIERLKSVRGKRGNPNFIAGRKPTKRKSQKKSAAKAPRK